jgi:O-antigen/teichoic acid export membrane protein
VLLSGRTFYNKEYWKFCLTLSLPLVFYSLSDLLLGQSDRVMLQHMLSEATVGQYSLAYNFAGIIFTIFGALNNTWVPFFFEDMKQGRREPMMAQAKNFLELYTVLSAGFVLLTTEVYHIFASREFWAGTLLIPVFVVGYYFNFLCTFPINYEYYRKKTKVVAIVTVAAAVFNVGLNYVLIKNMGLVGATLATAVSHGIQFAMHYLYVRYKLGREDYPFGLKVWLPYPLAFAAVLAVVYLLPDAALIRWGLGIAIGGWEAYRILKRKVLM